MAAATSTPLPPPPSTAPTGFGPQLPRLVAETNVVEATLTPNEKTVRVVRIGADGNGPFEWDYIQSADTPWLDVTRPLVIEEGDLDTLILNFDSTGLSPGRYEAMVAIFAVPVARDSPQTIDVSLTVT